MTGSVRDAETGSKGRQACLACQRGEAVLTEGWQARLALASTDRLWRCRHCGLAWLERPDSPSAATYEDTYFSDYAEQSMPGGIDEVPPHIDERLDDLGTLLGRTGTFLDIGCGYGNVLHAARERGWRTEGLDISEWSAGHIRRTRGIPVTVGDVLAVNFADAAFDVIHMSHALEHMSDPRAVLSRIRRWLRPDGVVIIEVPNQLDELYAVARWTVMRRYVPPPVANSHEFFFSSRSLDLLLTATGYRGLVLRTERRNVDKDSRLPLGAAVKRVLFDVERRLARGPNIVSWARVR